MEKSVVHTRRGAYSLANLFALCFADGLHVLLSERPQPHVVRCLGCGKQKTAQLFEGGQVALAPYLLLEPAEKRSGKVALLPSVSNEGGHGRRGGGPGKMCVAWGKFLLMSTKWFSKFWDIFMYVLVHTCVQVGAPTY